MIQKGVIEHHQVRDYYREVLIIIIIVDYGSGNLRSIQKSIEQYYADVRISHALSLIQKARGIVLPGVGSFGDAITKLTEIGLFDYLKANIGRIPTLGICLGMQLLFSTSEETMNAKGLNLIPGKVFKLNNSLSIRIPHTGWNRLIPVLKPDFNGYVYFNHSYYCKPHDIKVIINYVLHGRFFPAIIKKGNILGTQFHPEKSKEPGNKILEYFVSMIKERL